METDLLIQTTDRRRTFLQTLVCVYLLLLLPMQSLAEGVLRLGVSDTAIGFGPYAQHTPGQPLSGALIDFWRCVLAPEPERLAFSLRPSLRSSQELALGKIDLQTSSFRGTTEADTHLAVGAVYTDPIHRLDIVLVALAADKPLLQDSLWLKQDIGVVQRSVFHDHLVAQGATISMRVANVEQLLKLLLTGRLSVIAFPSPWPSDEIRRYMGSRIVARTLNTYAVHGIMSRQRYEQDPALMGRVNERIPLCRPSLAAIDRNPLQ